MIKAYVFILLLFVQVVMSTLFGDKRSRLDDFMQPDRSINEILNDCNEIRNASEFLNETNQFGQKQEHNKRC